MNLLSFERSFVFFSIAVIDIVHSMILHYYYVTGCFCIDHRVAYIISFKAFIIIYYKCFYNGISVGLSL